MILHCEILATDLSYTHYPWLGETTKGKTRRSTGGGGKGWGGWDGRVKRKKGKKGRWEEGGGVERRGTERQEKEKDQMEVNEENKRRRRRRMRQGQRKDEECYYLI